MNDTFIPFALHTIEQDEIDEVVDTLKSNWITTGPKTKLFEKQFADYIGVKHAISVNSCTAALHLALEAINIQEKDLVITTPFTFTATAETIRYLNAEPLFIDIDQKTFNMDAYRVEEFLQKSNIDLNKIKAILPVHYGGQACDMDAIIRVAKKYNLKVIDDAAHALPTTYKGQKIGTIGDLTCFSFYATKTITTGEGGMVVSNDDNIIERIRTMRLHGINRDVFNRYNSDKAEWYYEVVAPGFKYNLTDIASAIGLHQLKKVERFQKEREKIALMYNEAFQNLVEIEIPYIQHPENKHAWHLYVIKINLEKLMIDRSEFINQLKKAGIGTSVHFIPLHMQPYYRQRYGFKPTDFPVTYSVYNQVLSLPIYPKMTENDVKRVVTVVKNVIQKNKKIKNI